METRAGKEVFQRGVEKGVITSLRLVLERRFGELSAELVGQIEGLTAVQLETVLDQAVSVATLSEFAQWLARVEGVDS